MKLGVKRSPRYILTRDVQSFLRLSQDFNYDDNRKALYERLEETTIRLHCSIESFRWKLEFSAFQKSTVYIELNIFVFRKIRYSTRHYAENNDLAEHEYNMRPADGLNK